MSRSSTPSSLSSFDGPATPQTPEQFQKDEDVKDLELVTDEINTTTAKPDIQCTSQVDNQESAIGDAVDCFTAVLQQAGRALLSSTTNDTFVSNSVNSKKGDLKPGHTGFVMEACLEWAHDIVSGWSPRMKVPTYEIAPFLIFEIHPAMRNDIHLFLQDWCGFYDPATPYALALMDVSHHGFSRHILVVLSAAMIYRDSMNLDMETVCGEAILIPQNHSPLGFMLCLMDMRALNEPIAPGGDWVFDLLEEATVAASRHPFKPTMTSIKNEMFVWSAWNVLLDKVLRDSQEFRSCHNEY